MSAMTDYKTLADEINASHDLAMKHADTAIEHAKHTGALLLKAKAEIQHGDFQAWLQANVSCSIRQAQRYMRAAQGKPITARSVVKLPKNDTVSFLPSDGKGAIAILDRDGAGAPTVFIRIEPDHVRENVYHLLVVIGTIATSTKKRGVHAAGVESVLSYELPRHYMPHSPDRFNWKYYDQSSAHSLQSFISTVMEGEQ